MQFKRFYTKAGIHPFDEVTWITTIAEIINHKDPERSFCQEDVEFPDFYSKNAVNIIASKYFAGIIGVDREYSLKQLIYRIVDTIRRWGNDRGYFDTNDDEIIFKDELTYMLLHQIYAFNSPVWFNLGNKFRNGKYQSSACFISRIDDTLESIGESLNTWMQIFKDGSGVGSNKSLLRSSHETISGGGSSSGPCSFTRIHDQVGAVTKSGGISRRAAIMEILDIDHGDIETFIWQKKREEDKAKVLIKAGYSIEEAINSVFFQNSNQSVRAFDSFMKCVEGNEEWALLERKSVNFELIEDMSRTTSQGDFYLYNSSWYIRSSVSESYYKVIKWIKARVLFSSLVKCAWETGDPGIQFHDTINSWHTCPNDGEIRASNPCSEYMFLDDTSCNLGSLNLLKFIDDNGLFYIKSFQHSVRIALTAQDILVDYSSYPTERIAEKTKRYRTLGLGYTNLGAYLLRHCIAYDSDKGRNYAAAINALMHNTAYKVSSEIAKILGPFKAWEGNREPMRNIMKRHLDATIKLTKVPGYDLNFTEIISTAVRCAQQNAAEDKQFRNAQVTVLAPTGTISFIMDCETTGIEPALDLVTYKNLVGGGMLKLTVPSVEIALQKLGYDSTSINDMTDSIVNPEKHSISFIQAIQPEHRKIFATALSKDNFIDPIAHVKMMAVVQPFLSGAISKTVNLPNKATEHDVANVYMQAWKLGLKSIAIYRDGSKVYQPVTTDKKEEIKPETVVVKTEKLSNGRPKPVRKHMATTREALTHKFSIGGQEGYLTVGLFENGDLGETFINMSKTGNTIRGLMDAIGLLLSVSLQYGVPLRDIVDKFKNTKFDPAGFTQNKSIPFAHSVLDYIAKWLEQEFLDDDISAPVMVPVKERAEFDGPICPNCGSIAMIKAGSCYTCSDCGNSTGCG